MSAAVALFTVPVSAQVMGASVAYSDKQCLAEYRGLSPQQLVDGTCFDAHRPFGRCNKLIPKWTDIQTLTSTTCLNVFKDLSLNINTPNYQINEALTFQQWRENYAYHLVLNAEYLNILDELEQFELKELAKNAKGRFK